MHAHPTEGQLQALLDRELAPSREVVVRAHLLRCAACRARVDAARETTSMVGALLRRSTPMVDRESAWQRLVALSGGRAERRWRRPGRWPSTLALAAVAAVLFAVLPRGPSSASMDEDAFALVREAEAHPARALLRDACCSDHDGGDRADDGLLTLSRPGETVTVVILYEDVDHTGTFTHDDIVRYVSTVPHVLARTTAPLTAR